MRKPTLQTQSSLLSIKGLTLRPSFSRKTSPNPSSSPQLDALGYLSPRQRVSPDGYSLHFTSSPLSCRVAWQSPRSSEIISRVLGGLYQILLQKLV